MFSVKPSCAKYVFAVLFLASHPLGSYAQEIGVGTLDNERITAGKTFHLTVKFAEAPTFETWVQQMFDYKPVTGIPTAANPGRIACDGRTKAGADEAVLECTVPIDAVGGTYQASTLFRLGPIPGGSRERDFKITVPDIEVVPVQDTNVYPTSAVATISLDQQQVLTSGAAKIVVLLDQLNIRVDQSGAETADLKAFLSNLVKTAQGELGKSRKAFDEKLPDGAKEPIFFEDFSRQYTALIVDINAPQNTAFPVHRPNAPHLQMIQLSSNQTVTVRPPELGGSLGPLVSKVAELMGDHVAAFLRISETGSTTFTISLKSTPPGATVSYKRIGEAYQDYSSPTDVNQATFPYALWTFRFTLAGCEVVKHPNPYIEKSPNLNALMQDCKKK